MLLLDAGEVRAARDELQAYPSFDRLCDYIEDSADGLRPVGDSGLCCGLRLSSDDDGSFGGSDGDFGGGDQCGDAAGQESAAEGSVGAAPAGSRRRGRPPSALP